MKNLQPPFDTFRLEKHAGQHKDFGLAPDDPYPLKGVTYPVDYGDISGYIGEDGANLDIFLGSKGDINGYIVVSRPDVSGGEHKFYVNLTRDEEQALLDVFGPVIISNSRVQSAEALAAAIAPFKK